MRRIQAAIFDMDGLMVDTEDLYFQAESEVARRHGKSFDLQLMQKMMGHKAVRSIQIMMETLGIEGSAREIETLRDSLYRDLLVKGVKPMHGLFELFEWLEINGFRKAVATSSKPEFKDIIFNHLSLEDRFEVVITADEISEGKPSPEIYQLVLRRLGLQPRQSIVLEDSAPGLKAAKGADCFCIIVPNRYTQNQDFSGADLVTSHLFRREIRRLFQEL